MFFYKKRTRGLCKWKKESLEEKLSLRMRFLLPILEDKKLLCRTVFYGIYRMCRFLLQMCESVRGVA